MCDRSDGFCCKISMVRTMCHTGTCQVHRTLYRHPPFLCHVDMFEKGTCALYPPCGHYFACVCLEELKSSCKHFYQRLCVRNTSKIEQIMLKKSLLTFSSLLFAFGAQHSVSATVCSKEDSKGDSLTTCSEVQHHQNVAQEDKGLYTTFYLFT